MRVLVTGGTGMVGCAFRSTQEDQFIKVGSSSFDLSNFTDCLNLISKHRPDAVIHLAAKVGGVKGNTDYVADFYTENILINTYLLEACRWYKVSKVVSLLSTCIYPDSAKYPLTEEQIHGGEPHESNFGYAYAKRMLHIQSKAYRKQYGCNYVCAVPNNIFGKGDNFDLENGHVIPAIIRKIYEAKKNNNPSVTFWGDGTPLREFTYNQDIANALVFLLKNYDESMPVNIGNTKEVSIRHVVEKVSKIYGYEGEILWDTSKPSGQFRKPSSNQRFIDLGWDESSYTSLDSGLKFTCKWFADNYPNVRGLITN